MNAQTHPRITAVELFDLGYVKQVPIVPVGAEKAPWSHLSPDQFGKSPGVRGADGLWSGMKDWPHYEATRAAAAAHDSWGAGTGILAGQPQRGGWRVIGIDVDVLDASTSVRVRSAIEKIIGPVSPRVGFAPKFLVPVRTKTDRPYRKLIVPRSPGGAKSGKDEGVEFLSAGKQFVISGIHAGTGKPYQWVPCRVEDLAEVDDAQLDAIEAAIRSEIPGVKTSHTGRATNRDNINQETLRGKKEDLDRALEALPNDADYDGYIRVLCAGLASYPNRLDAEEALHAWSSKSAKYTREATDRFLKGLKGPFAIGATWLMQLADAQSRGRFRWTDTVFDVEEAPSVPDRPSRWSDDTLALEFADARQNQLRFVSNWGRWMEWCGHHWRTDETLIALDMARQNCRQSAKTALSEPGERKAVQKLARELTSAKTINAVERLARSGPLSASVGQWDADLWILNTPGGIVDLRTGETRPSDRLAYCTKSTAVAPAPEGAVPHLWLSFLHRITAGSADLTAFLQRLAGYCLTGDTSAHALAFAYGTGANGKSVFTNTVSGVMGDYATSTPIETFMATGSDRHPTELADLRGARLVTASETEEGRRWAESRIKQMTGGDPIKARFMNRDFFEYQPQFTLLLSGNHKPGLRGVDEAIRRRLHLIPFTVTIPPEERDPGLPEKLREEWPAVLRWMINGCLEWQRAGLAPPDAVRAATASYLADEDSLATWIEECCLVEATSWGNSTELFLSWKTWAERTGAFVGSQKRFSGMLEARGFHPKKEAGTGRRGFLGVKIMPVDSIFL